MQIRWNSVFLTVDGTCTVHVIAKSVFFSKVQFDPTRVYIMYMYNMYIWDVIWENPAHGEVRKTRWPRFEK